MYQFSARGHPDIVGTHKRQLSFVASPAPDSSALGVDASYDLQKLKDYLRYQSLFVLHIIAGDESVSVTAQHNPDYDSEGWMLLHRGLEPTVRTLGIASSHAAIDLPRSMITRLQDPHQEVRLQIEKTTQ